MFRFLLGAALLLGASSLAAQETNPPARRLVLAMAADESAAVETQLGYRSLIAEGQVTQKEADCMQKVDRTAFTDVFARTMTEQLTGDEIQQALEFYESDLGKKFVQVQMSDTYEQFNAVPPAPSPELSDGEKSAIGTFLGSSAGNKLVANAVLTDSPAGRKAARDLLLQLLARCKA